MSSLHIESQLLQNPAFPLEPSDVEVEHENIRTLVQVKEFLSYHITQNYTGNSFVGENEDVDLPISFSTPPVTNDEIILDGEALIENIRSPHIVVHAEKLLEQLSDSSLKCLLSLPYWKIRTYFLHQRFLDEKSSTLWTKLQSEIEEMNVNIGKFGRTVQIQYYVELSEIYSYYYDIENGKKWIELAKKMAGLRVGTTGVLGKRTRYQQTELAQLVLEVERNDIGDNELNFDFNGGDELQISKENLPKSVILEDEDRLDKINVIDTEFRGLDAGTLAPIQHLVVLADFHLKRKYLPVDGIYLEELLAYLSFLINNPKVWTVQIVALLQRSILETNQRRTVERSMKQFEVLKDAILCKETPLAPERLQYFYGSGLGIKSEVMINLADVLSSLHLFKEALDIYLRYKKWENVISCYHSLQLRHKAEEIIREQLELKPDNVKLWILLGDATDNVEYYEKAYELSKGRSARAQRQWGYYYFVRKQYAESIPHLEKSLELNPLENPTWIRLGYAALDTGNWKLSTKAYQHSSTLDGDNFEVWNNLAHGFIKSGEKLRALRALKEASKCNYENWKVWENTLIVSIDLRAMDEVLRAYNRLIDLKGKWIDEEVLTLLVRGILMNVKDMNDVPCQEKYLKGTLQLFGRITSVVTNNAKIWKLYSDLILLDQTEPNPELRWTKSINYSQKSVQSLLSDTNWAKTEDDIRNAVELTIDYIKRLNDYKELPETKNVDDSKNLSTLLTSAQFTVKRVYGTIKKLRDTSINSSKYEEYLNEILTHIQSLGIEL